MAITWHEDDSTRVAEMVVSGRITHEDYETAVTPMQAFIDRHGTVKFLEIIETFEGFDSAMVWPGIEFDIKNIRHISHVAVVSDIGWIGPVSRAAGALISTRLRTFALAEVNEARSWLATA